MHAVALADAEQDAQELRQYLADSQEQAEFLNDQEHAIALADAENDAHELEQILATGAVDTEGIFGALIKGATAVGKGLSKVAPKVFKGASSASSAAKTTTKAAKIGETLAKGA